LLKHSLFIQNSFLPFAATQDNALVSAEALVKAQEPVELCKLFGVVDGGTGGGGGGGGSGSELCAPDCAGTSGGLAALDACGACVGGDTGRVANADMDCSGACYGPLKTELGRVARNAFGDSACGCERVGASALFCAHYQRPKLGADELIDTLDDFNYYYLGLFFIVFVALAATLSACVSKRWRAYTSPDASLARRLRHYRRDSLNGGGGGGDGGDGDGTRSVDGNGNGDERHRRNGAATPPISRGDFEFAEAVFPAPVVPPRQSSRAARSRSLTRQ
jgi:hypothetical protein